MVSNGMMMSDRTRVVGRNVFIGTIVFFLVMNFSMFFKLNVSIIHGDRDTVMETMHLLPNSQSNRPNKTIITSTVSISSPSVVSQRRQEELVATSQPQSTPTTTATTTTTTTMDTTMMDQKKYAYTWVIGAIDGERPAYKGFLYDILVSVHLLKKLGSEADFWIVAQLSHNATGNELPTEDVRVLQALGIHIKLLDKPVKSSFAHLVYEKFHPLQFTQYRRIMFLDADILPLVNMDYLFHLSDPEHTECPTILRPNLILATRGEPCNTGMFIMHPEPGAWDAVQRIVDRQHELGKKLPYPHFDRADGWGHNFRKEGDFWEAIKKNGTKWDYHAVHSDQGLWYYFQKYVQQNVSIIIGDRLQNITPGPDGKPQKEEFRDVLTKYSPTPIADQHRCMKGNRNFGQAHICNPVYRDFAHFMGKKKPWFKMPCRGCGAAELHQPHQRWFDELAEINREFKMGLDMEHFEEKHIPYMQESPLGYQAQFGDHMEKVMLHGKSAMETNTTTR